MRSDILRTWSGTKKEVIMRAVWIGYFFIIRHVFPVSEVRSHGSEIRVTKLVVAVDRRWSHWSAGPLALFLLASCPSITASASIMSKDDAANDGLADTVCGLPIYATSGVGLENDIPGPVQDRMYNKPVSDGGRYSVTIIDRSVRRLLMSGKCRACVCTAASVIPVVSVIFGDLNKLAGLTCPIAGRPLVIGLVSAPSNSSPLQVNSTRV
jgi:hypothetical protein